jgi:hypothetical protein
MLNTNEIFQKRQGYAPIDDLNNTTASATRLSVPLLDETNMIKTSAGSDFGTQISPHLLGSFIALPSLG